MARDTISRRHFMQGSGAVAGGTLIRLGMPAAMAAAQAACTARDEGAVFETLTEDEARELDAIAARILPTTHTPGARDAGVIYFIDTVLGKQLAGMLDRVRSGLVEFQAGLAGPTRFSALDESAQDAYLAERERSRFFGTMRMLTLIGFLAMERYGGNRDSVGWKLIGFEGHGAAQPPFGYYDAQYMEAERDGDR